MGNSVGEKMEQSLKKKEANPGSSARVLEKLDIGNRPDRVGKYFRKYTKNFVFDEFSDAFLRKGHIDFMKGVPIPFRKEDLEAFKGEEGLKMQHIMENIAWMMGIDPKFEHGESYLRFMRGFGDKRTSMALVREARDEAEKKDYETAAIHLRAALCVSPANLRAMYSYARVCRELYLSGSDEEYIGRFKAESMEYFELITEVYPKFAQAHYFLGYAYLNMGLYTKAKLVWEQFLKRSANEKDIEEIKVRLQQLADPVRIEEGCNAVLSGRYELGIDILEPFIDTKFKDWWPMSYYLGIAYERTGKNPDAVESFKRVLGINPSHVESMEELAKIYAEIDDKENENKYREKAELIRSGGHKN